MQATARHRAREPLYVDFPGLVHVRHALPNDRAVQDFPDQRGPQNSMPPKVPKRSCNRESTMRGMYVSGLSLEYRRGPPR